MNLGQELLNVPMGQMIRDMAFAIADAQVELDAFFWRSFSARSRRVTNGALYATCNNKSSASASS